MTWFPNIPVSKYGTKHKEKIQLTNENKKAKRESSKSFRTHTIKKVKKNSVKMSEIAKRKITDVKNLIFRFGTFDTNYINNGNGINLIAALAVQHEIFDNTTIAKIFIINYKEKIFD